MITNILCIICKDIIEDKATRMVSYINCVEQVGVNKFPSSLPSLSLGTTWIKDSDSVETFKIRVKLLFPDEEEKILIETPDNTMKGLRHRINCIINGFPIKKEGLHRLIVEKLCPGGWEFAATASFLAVLNIGQSKKAPVK